MRFSTNDYSGSEATLTYGTFSGVFITAAAAGSVVDSTTIKAASQFDNSTLVGDNPLYSIGLVGTDGNTTALIAVSTTTAPDIIRPAVTGVSTYAFNMNITVSSTNNITVVGTTAAVLYDVDVVDNLISTATDKPLSANQGRVLNENKAERADLATLNLTGSTNTTGSTINAGTYFYLNGSYCKSKTNIANGATFTLNTNFEVTDVSSQLPLSLDGNTTTPGVSWVRYGNVAMINVYNVIITADLTIQLPFKSAKYTFTSLIYSNNPLSSMSINANSDTLVFGTTTNNGVFGSMMIMIP